jgi:hypothetical protein
LDCKFGNHESQNDFEKENTYLIASTVNDILIMVDTTDRRLVEAGLDWCLQVGDIPDISHREPVRSGASSVDFIQFVVEKEILLIFRVENPSLMRVRGADIACPGDDRRVGFVRNICGGQSD